MEQELESKNMWILKKMLNTSISANFQEWKKVAYPTPYTLHPARYTLNPAPYTLHPTPYTPHPTPHTLHPTPYTLHPTPYTLHPTPYTGSGLAAQKAGAQRPLRGKVKSMSLKYEPASEPLHISVR